MKIGVDAARGFFDHPTQRRGAMIDPNDLPDDGMIYWSEGPICGAFHRAPWDGAWFAHYGALPDGWGRLTAPAKRILQDFSASEGARFLIGWTDVRNRAALAFARRIGFQQTGTLDAGRVIVSEWRPE